ncbi:cilia- and flagella-associated protein 95-like [Ptychodera flava]|uniref:cilia- and flagella-associated protein 95-like n=1 Tax=Ptychodera flava TaxID=63121 RepID=UPI00396A561C
MAYYNALPDFVERKGSLYLRSDHMNYGRPTLNSNWHQAREAEPKDYEINKEPPKRNLHNATYNRIGDVTDGSYPKTTYQDSMEQIFLKKDFDEQETRKPMVNLQTVGDADIDRDTGLPKSGYSAVLPRHYPEHDKQHLETTHRVDYKPPYPYTPTEEKPADFPDNSNAYRKCHSQFTDTADYRRYGRNTWQDETGIYANSRIKHEVFPPTKTIPVQLE